MSSERAPGRAETAPARPLKRVGGRLCLDFVNSVSAWEPVGARSGYVAGEERLGDFASFAAWSAATPGGRIGRALAGRIARAARRDPRTAAEVWRRAASLRATLYPLLRAAASGRPPSATEAAALELEWRKARAAETLRQTRRGFEIAPDTERPGGLLELPLYEVALSAVELLVSSELTRVRACPGEQCGWLFLDTSKSGRRRWCDMSDCGNVAKVRRFRARLAEGAG